MEQLKENINIGEVPFVVLLSTKLTKKLIKESLFSLINFLLAQGTRIFVCIGRKSEILHDSIDRIIDEYEEKNNLDISAETLTTYHENETLENSVNYFINGTILSNSKNNILLAILDDSEKNIKDLLISM